MTKPERVLPPPKKRGGETPEQFRRRAIWTVVLVVLALVAVVVALIKVEPALPASKLYSFELSYGQQVSLAQIGSKAVMGFGTFPGNVVAVSITQDGSTTPVLTSTKTKIDIGEIWVDSYRSESTVTVNANGVNGKLVAIIKVQQR